MHGRILFSFKAMVVVMLLQTSSIIPIFSSSERQIWIPFSHCGLSIVYLKPKSVQIIYDILLKIRHSICVMYCTEFLVICIGNIVLF
jgi:hypothetical protein